MLGLEGSQLNLLMCELDLLPDMLVGTGFPFRLGASLGII